MARWEFDIPEGVREEWRVVPSYPLYQVSDYGRVRRTGNKRTIAQRLSAQGFPQVTLSIRNQTVVRFVHVLVAEAFIGPQPFDYFVQHVDGDKVNNTAENLAYARGVGFSGRAVNLGQQASSVVQWSKPPGWYVHCNAQVVAYYPPSDTARHFAQQKVIEETSQRGGKLNTQEGGAALPFGFVVDDQNRVLEVLYAICVPEENDAG
jgi:hypothetical protein